MRRMNAAAASGVTPEYDPITAFNWQYLYWANGPSMEGLTNGQTIASWPDEMGNANMNTAAGAVGWYSTGLALNNKAYVLLDGGDRMDQSGYSSHSTYSIVWIGYMPAGSTNRWQDNMLGGGRVIPMVPYSGNHQIYFGGSAGQTTPVSLPGAYAQVSVNNGSNDRGYSNGSLLYSGSFGSDAVNGLRWFGNVSLAFYGVWTGGNIVDQAGWGDFQAWSLEYYGVNP